MDVLRVSSAEWRNAAQSTLSSDAATHVPALALLDFRDLVNASHPGGCRVCAAMQFSQCLEKRWNRLNAGGVFVAHRLLLRTATCLTDVYATMDDGHAQSCLETLLRDPRPSRCDQPRRRLQRLSTGLS